MLMMLMMDCMWLLLKMLRTTMFVMPLWQMKTMMMGYT
jgi:hypothetical protein